MLLLLRAVGWREQVSHREDEKEELDYGAYWIVLVRDFDVADQDCRARDGLECVADQIEEVEGGGLEFRR